MKHYLITISGKTYDVEVLDDPRKEDVRVRVDGEALTVNVKLMSEQSAAIKPSAPVAANVPAAAAPTLRLLRGDLRPLNLLFRVWSIPSRSGQAKKYPQMMSYVSLRL